MREVCIGWDGASKPIIRLAQECGCQFYRNGTLARRCSAHTHEAFQRIALEQAEAARREHDPLTCRLGGHCPFPQCK